MFHKNRHEGAGTPKRIKEARVAGAQEVSVGGGGGQNLRSAGPVGDGVASLSCSEGNRATAG